MKRAWTTTIFLLIATLLWAQSVDREELESQITGSVEFQNFEGTHEVVETIEQIRGIGEDLGQLALAPGNSRSYAGRYQVVHAVDPESNDGLDADIFFILDNANVNHINNVRRILQAYLERAYAYSENDAATLAEFVTIYNALYRGRLDFFRGRYKQVVLDNLTEEGVGISTLYSEWPGNTEMVIPLSRGATPGQIGALDPLALTDPGVIDQLRMREDMGIAERKALVDIMERLIQEEQQQIEEQQEEIAEQREQLQQQEEQLQQQDQETEEQPLQEEQATEPAAEDDAEPVEQPTEGETQQTEEDADEATTQEEIDQQQEELAEQEQEVQERQERVEQMEEEVREQREQIAQDQEEQLEEQTAAEPVVFLRVRERDGELRRQFVLVQPQSGEVVQESPVDAITSQSPLTFQEELLVVGQESGSSRLLLVDGASLELLRRGETTVYPESVLEAGPNGVLIYAVVQQEENWYLGRFDRNLELQERSSVQVMPYTSLSFSENSIFVQSADGEIVTLSLETMSAGEGE